MQRDLLDLELTINGRVAKEARINEGRIIVTESYTDYKDAYLYPMKSSAALLDGVNDEVIFRIQKSYNLLGVVPSLGLFYFDREFIKADFHEDLRRLYGKGFAFNEGVLFVNPYLFEINSLFEKFNILSDLPYTPLLLETLETGTIKQIAWPEEFKYCRVLRIKIESSDKSLQLITSHGVLQIVDQKLEVVSFTEKNIAKQPEFISFINKRESNLKQNLPQQQTSDPNAIIWEYKYSTDFRWSKSSSIIQLKKPSGEFSDSIYDPIFSEAEGIDVVHSDNKHFVKVRSKDSLFEDVYVIEDEILHKISSSDQSQFVHHKEIYFFQFGQYQYLVASPYKSDQSVIYHLEGKVLTPIFQAKYIFSGYIDQDKKSLRYEFEDYKHSILILNSPDNILFATYPAGITEFESWFDSDLLGTTIYKAKDAQGNTRLLTFNGHEFRDFNESIDLYAVESVKLLHDAIYFTSSDSQIICKVKADKDGLSQKRGQIFSKEYGDVLNSFLIKYKFYLEDNPSVKTKLLRNLWRIPAEDLSLSEIEKMLPWCFFISPDSYLSIPKEVKKKADKLFKEDPQKLSAFCQIIDEVWLRNSSAKTFENRIFGNFCQRWFVLFSELPEQAKVILSLLNSKHEIDGKFLVGKDFLRPDAVTSSPLQLRHYLEYLFGEHQFALAESSTTDSRDLNPDIKIKDMPLAAIVATSILERENLAEFKSLDSFATQVAAHFEHVELSSLTKEIVKTVTAQERNAQTWIRELVQNARDAIKSSLSPIAEIKLQSLIEGDNWVFSCTDPVGMTLQEVVDYLLVPDRSSKERSTITSGFFGHGFFTCFQGADVVEIKTSKGNGKVLYLQIICEKDEHGELKDLIVDHFAEANEDFTGTVIKRKIKATRLQAELMHALTSSCTYTYISTVPSSDCAITFNDHQINKPGTVLSIVPTVHGDLKVTTKYDGFSRITINDLFLTHLQHEKFGTFIPESLLQTLSTIGLCIDLPSGLRPTRTRNALSQEEKVLEDLQRLCAISCMRACIKLYVEEDRDISGIPRGYLYTASRHSVKDPHIIEDAKKINSVLTDPQDYIYGLSTIDFRKYLGKDGGYALSQLLTLIQCQLVQGDEIVTCSLEELRNELLKINAQHKSESATLESTQSQGQDDPQNSKVDINKVKMGQGFERQVQEAAHKMGIEVRQGVDGSPISDKKEPITISLPKSNRRIIHPQEPLFLEISQKFLQFIRPGVQVRMFEDNSVVVAYWNQEDNCVMFNSYHIKKIFLTLLERICQNKASIEDRDMFIEKLSNLLTHEITHADEGTLWTHQNSNEFAESFRVRMQKIVNNVLRELDVDFFQNVGLTQSEVGVI